MTIDLGDFDQEVREAVKAFWTGRSLAVRKQQTRGKADQGERAGVTSGKNMDGFVAMVEKMVRQNGLSHADIHLERRALTLPGYFRPTKLWDMLVMNHGRLIAALEFKSQVGPSFGNNFNNRSEEAIGTAIDLWTAFRAGAFGDSQRPFVGWMMLVEECDGSRTPIKDRSPHFPVFPDFKDASYADRYDILCKKLVREQLYTTASVVLSPRTAEQTGAFRNLSEMTSLRSFIASFAGHIASEAAR
ncbi:MAG: PaeR7I family type II restriction endonuclease [Magnetococcus sp. YQC-5]